MRRLTGFGLEHQSAGTIWPTLPAPERAEILAVAAEVKAAGLGLRAVWDGYRLAGACPSTTPHSLGGVVAELLAAKEAAGRSRDYVSSLRITLGQFATGREAAPVAGMSVADIEDWLASKGAASHSTNRARLATMFGWCVRRGYRADNPCDRLETVTAPPRAPDVFTPEQAAMAIQWLRKNAPSQSCPRSSQGKRHRARTGRLRWRL